MNKIEILNFNHYFKYYLILLGFCALTALNYKYNIGNDSTISEWIINYQGGFIRRGLLGEIAFKLALLFDLSLGKVIFYMQSISYLFLLFLNFIFFIKFRQNIFTLFVIFTPIFILYPVAEIEVLARKEVFMYIFFLGLFFISTVKDLIKNSFLNIYIIFICPIVCLIYEQFILFFPFILVYLIFEKNIKDLISFFRLLLNFIPSILIVSYFLFKPITYLQHELMKKSLLEYFNEKCYMSCELLFGNDITKFSDLLLYIYGASSFKEISIWIFRYIIIFLIGFFPLLIMIFHSKIKKETILTNFYKLNLISIFTILFILILPLFIFGSDWGRWVGMMISFSIYLYFFLIYKGHISVNYKKLIKSFSFLKNKKKIIIFIFVIFSFGWNQKTSISGDIATNPLWKVPYNTLKKNFNFGSKRYFQDSPLIKWHKKYIE